MILLAFLSTAFRRKVAYCLSNRAKPIRGVRVGAGETVRLNGFYTHTLNKRLFPGKRNLISEILAKNVFHGAAVIFNFFFALTRF